MHAFSSGKIERNFNRRLRRHARSKRRPALLALLILVQSVCLPGCGALLLVGGAGSSAIAFVTGELRTTEAIALAPLHEACRTAIETLGYDEVRVEEQKHRRHWQATTAGGDPVDIRLIQRDLEQTEVRIRVGVFGNEGRSRLVLEEIRRSL